MGCVKSKNIVQPQGQFSVVTLPLASNLLHPEKKSGKNNGMKAKKHKPNTLVPEPLIESAALTLNSTANVGPSSLLLPSSGLETFESMSFDELSVQFLKAVKAGDNISMQKIYTHAVHAHLSPSLINFRGMWESTPLIYACQYNHPTAALWLLSNGVDIYAENEKGVTALLLASLEGMTDVVDLILKRQTSSGEQMARAVDDQIGVVYNSAADLNVRLNPLLAASMNGHVEIVSLLLAEGGASVNKGVQIAHTGSSTSSSHYALLLAAKHGHTAVVQLLMRSRANLLVCGAGDNHALLLACEAAKDECAMALLEHLASLKPAAVKAEVAAVWKAANCHGFTALHFAAMHGLTSVCAYMLHELKWKDDASFLNATTTARGENALLVACRKKQDEIVRFLVVAGADATLAGRGNITAEQVLRRDKKDELLQLCEATRRSRAEERSSIEAEVVDDGGRNDNGYVNVVITHHEETQKENIAEEHCSEPGELTVARADVKEQYVEKEELAPVVMVRKDIKARRDTGFALMNRMSLQPRGLLVGLSNTMVAEEEDEEEIECDEDLAAALIEESSAPILPAGGSCPTSSLIVNREVIFGPNNLLLETTWANSSSSEKSRAHEDGHWTPHATNADAFLFDQPNHELQFECIEHKLPNKAPSMPVLHPEVEQRRLTSKERDTGDISMDLPSTNMANSNIQSLPEDEVPVVETPKKGLFVEEATVLKDITQSSKSPRKQKKSRHSRKKHSIDSTTSSSKKISHNTVETEDESLR